MHLLYFLHSLIIQEANGNRLQRSANETVLWSENNFMKLNATKTKEIVFR